MRTPSIQTFFRPQNLILIFSTGLIILNAFYLFIFTCQKYVNRMDWVEPGYQFHMFLPHLDNITELGYITDKTLTREVNDGIYLQSQYFLAPRLIKEGYHADQFNILDTDNPDFIRKTYLATKSQRVANNVYGQALIKKGTP